MTMHRKPWYKKWWGIIIAILILPYFLIWFVLAKTKWGRLLKTGATAALVALCILYFAWFTSWASQQPQPVAQKTKYTQGSNKQITGTIPSSKAGWHSSPINSSSSASVVATRKVTGQIETLGAGTFTGGKDVAVGLYDVTTAAGQTGNFIVNDGGTYDEVLGEDGSGLGVSKIRVKINNGDQIQISGLSSVTFTPVSTTFVTTRTVINLYAGTFTVGQDVGAGRYVVTPGAGQSGNFIVNNGDSYNKVLGTDSSLDEVPRLTVSLKKGDTIDISGMSQVIFTPSS